MYKNFTILGFIPARSGSKGIPNKNIKELKGKPLIQYTIEPAFESKYIDSVILSTDSPNILKIGQKMGIDNNYLRPSELATDNSKAIDAVKHFLLNSDQKFDLIVYLEPTSPLRETYDIDQAIESFCSKFDQYDSLVTVSDANQYHPIFMKKIENNRLLPMFLEELEGTPRQLIEPRAYMRNGLVYIVKPDNILKGVFYGENILPLITPLEKSISIDDLLDWHLVEAYLK